MGYKITEVWVCRPRGVIFPEPIYDKLNNLIGLENKKVLHLFSGKSKVGETCDINAYFKPKHNIDCTAELPFESGSFERVIADPPYYDGHQYGVKPYSFVKEAARVLKIGGYFAILHPLRYCIPKGMEAHALIGITTGPNLKARWLSIFKKISNEDIKEVNQKLSMRKMV